MLTEITRELRQYKPLPMPTCETKVIRDSTADFRIKTDPDPDV